MNSVASMSLPSFTKAVRSHFPPSTRVTVPVAPWLAKVTVAVAVFGSFVRKTRSLRSAAARSICWSAVMAGAPDPIWISVVPVLEPTSADVTSLIVRPLMIGLWISTTVLGTSLSRPWPTALSSSSWVQRLMLLSIAFAVSLSTKKIGAACFCAVRSLVPWDPGRRLKKVSSARYCAVSAAARWSCAAVRAASMAGEVAASVSAAARALLTASRSA
ncbi:unannotated protein [freshwater metagenome]|uniref:Unannotated protein n=1 Tax=freshwater metagenome TaxID=449393 RepID=A0A6J7JVZ8_9ZZZZ